MPFNPNKLIILRNLNRLKGFSKNIILFIITSIIICVIFTIIDIYSFSRVNEFVNADAAIILGASVWNDKPSPVFQERINHGIWLYKNGYVKYLIFTGGFGKNSKYSEASVAMDFAIKNSISKEKIFIEETSKITFENIFYARNIIKNNSFDKVIVVSDPLHMKRAITMAKDLNLNVYSSPTPTTRYVSLKTKLFFLFYELLFFILYKIYTYLFIIFLYLFEILILIYIFKTIFYY